MSVATDCGSYICVQLVLLASSQHRFALQFFAHVERCVPRPVVERQHAPFGRRNRVGASLVDDRVCPRVQDEVNGQTGRCLSGVRGQSFHDVASPVARLNSSRSAAEKGFTE
jgi:hypothetical protein